jgi:hypothetical protein
MIGNHGVRGSTTALVLAFVLLAHACGAREADVAAPVVSPVPTPGEADGPDAGADAAAEPGTPPPTSDAGAPSDVAPADPAGSPAPADDLSGLLADADDGPSRCPPDPRPAHCILLELVDPDPAAAASLIERLRAEGLDAGADGDAVTLVMDDAAIQGVFGARVVYRVLTASATFRTLCEASLEGGRVPRGWRDRVRGFAIGHQLCE